MGNLAVSSNAVATLFALVLLAAPAQALNNKSWVAQPPAGDDAHLCTRASPCATLTQALTQTNAGGEIGFVDSGPYIGVSIDKSISIVAEGVDATIVPLIFPGRSLGVSAGSGVVRLQ